METGFFSQWGEWNKRKKVEVDVGNEVSAVAVDSPESHQLVSPLTFLDAFFALAHVFGNLWRKNDATPSEIHFFKLTTIIFTSSSQSDSNVVNEIEEVSFLLF